MAATAVSATGRKHEIVEKTSTYVRGRCGFVFSPTSSRLIISGATECVKCWPLVKR